MGRSLRSLRPTRRGRAVIALAVLAFVFGTWTSARSLNAVVVPAVVALAAGVVQLARAEAPTVEREPPDPGFPGEERRVGVTVYSSVPCTVTDAVDGDGLIAASEPAATVGHGGRFEYRVELGRRGAHAIGPATCRLTDSLGLFAVETTVDAETTGIVYPAVYEVDRARLAGLVRHVLDDERASFDRVREFAPGDTMRDIHWRASAKRPPAEFVVTEYESHTDLETIRVVGECALGSADAMASTVASVVAFLGEEGIAADVTVPAGRCDVEPGRYVSLLRLLALSEDGWVDARRRSAADVYVLGRGGRATVVTADREFSFDALARGERDAEVLA